MAWAVKTIVKGHSIVYQTISKHHPERASSLFIPNVGRLE